MARSFAPQKNNEPLYWSIGLAILAIWCFRDGWYPPMSKLEKYPEFPEEFWSFGLNYEFYRFNRVTSLICALAAIGLFVMHRVINKGAGASS